LPFVAHRRRSTVRVGRSGGLGAALVSSCVRDLIAVVPHATLGHDEGHRFVRVDIDVQGIQMVVLMPSAGWAAFDAGNPAVAQRFWLAGLRASHEAGSPALGANILRCMAEQSTSGNPRRPSRCCGRPAPTPDRR
jgi:hypothetical protein